MKIRSGFVSNSSSSNFLIHFNKIPTPEDVKEWLGDEVSKDRVDRSHNFIRNVLVNGKEFFNGSDNHRSILVGYLVGTMRTILVHGTTSRESKHRAIYDLCKMYFKDLDDDVVNRVTSDLCKVIDVFKEIGVEKIHGWTDEPKKVRDIMNELTDYLVDDIRERYEEGYVAIVETPDHMDDEYCDDFTLMMDMSDDEYLLGD